MESRKMTKRESDWTCRLRRCLEACPDSLELLTSGDGLIVIDRRRASGVELCDGAADKDGVVLSRMPGKPICHGVS